MLNRIKSILSRLKHQADDINPLIVWRLHQFKDLYIGLPLFIVIVFGMIVFAIAFIFSYDFHDSIFLIQYAIWISQVLVIAGIAKFVENMRQNLENQDELFKLHALSKKEKNAEDIILSIVPVLPLWCIHFVIVVVLTIIGGPFLILIFTTTVPILIWLSICLGIGSTSLVGVESKWRELTLGFPAFIYFSFWGCALIAFLLLADRTAISAIDLVNAVNPYLFFSLSCNCFAFLILCRDAWKTDPQTPFAGMRKKVSALLCLSVVNAVLWLVAYVRVLLSLQ